MSKPIIVDLFCGCGGFGLGAELAGFHTAVAVDIDETLQSAYKLNFPATQVENYDLSKTDSVYWEKTLRGEKVEGVIGGPPCQAFSRLGAGDVNDPRRDLLSHFFRNINILDPNFFIMENVEGLLDKQNKPQLTAALKTIEKKYCTIGPIIIDASLIGAPTKRKRVIVIGFKEDAFHEIDASDFSFPGLCVTVRDAISDLPEPIPQSCDSENFGWAKYKESPYALSLYAKKMRALPPKGLGCTESIRQLKAGLTSGHFETKHNKDVISRYSSLEQGKTDFISRAKKLAWDGHCPTLRAGTGPDRGSHQAVRPVHPESGRVITVREAARLQGFPDWFCFHPTKWHSFRMIGNSVSPIVSEIILKKIMAKMRKNQEKLIA